MERKTCIKSIGRVQAKQELFSCHLRDSTVDGRRWSKEKPSNDQANVGIALGGTLAPSHWCEFTSTHSFGGYIMQVF